MKFLPFVFLISGLLASSCQEFSISEQTETAEKPKKKLEGLVAFHRKDGTLASEITYKDKKKNGPARSYHPNGKLHIEMFYQNDLRQGLTKTYFANGKLYRESTYVQDTLDGIEKFYRSSGQLLAEVPYQMGQLGVGTVEYTDKGKLKQKMPAIKVQHINTVAQNNEYRIVVSLENKFSKDTRYYFGELTEGKYFNDNLHYLAASGTEAAELRYQVPPGTFLMETVNIVVKTKSQMGTPILLQKQVNVAAEHPIF